MKKLVSIFLFLSLTLPSFSALASSSNDECTEPHLANALSTLRSENLRAGDFAEEMRQTLAGSEEILRTAKSKVISATVLGTAGTTVLSTLGMATAGMLANRYFGKDHAISLLNWVIPGAFVGFISGSVGLPVLLYMSGKGTIEKLTQTNSEVAVANPEISKSTTQEIEAQVIETMQRYNEAQLDIVENLDEASKDLPARWYDFGWQKYRDAQIFENSDATSLKLYETEKEYTEQMMATLSLLCQTMTASR